MAKVHVEGTSWHETNRGVSIFICIYIALLVLVLSLSKWLHQYPKLGAILPEAGMIVLVGMLFGWIVLLIVGNHEQEQQQQHEKEEDDYYLAGDVVNSLLSFSSTAFFVILLPPIIFNSGYCIQKQLFFRHMTPICLYACLGTAVCTVVVATILYAASGLFSFQVSYLELLAFGALISATDPVSSLAVFSSKKVDPHLFYLVFGESMINDAVGLVLFEALAHLIEEQQHAAHAQDNGNQQEQGLNVGQEIAQFLVDFAMGFGGSLVLGTCYALLFGLFLKLVDMRHTPILELSTYVTLLYAPFCLAEVCHLSGIVTILFTGIAARRYCEPNLSAETAAHADKLFRMVAHLTETIIFLELGLSVAALVGVGAFHFGFIVCSLVACLVGRAVNIYPITYAYNGIVAWSQKQTTSKKRRRVESETAKTSVSPKHLVDDDHGREDNNSGNTDADKIVDDSQIPMSMAHMLWFSGLRGAVSYALVRTFPHTGNEAIFVVTTMFIVLLTTFLLGGSTEWALERLKIGMNVNEELYIRRLKPKKLLFKSVSKFEQKLRKLVIPRDMALSPRSKGDVEIAPNLTSDTAGSGDDDGSINSDYMMQDEPSQEIELAEKDHMQRTAVSPTNRNGLYDFGGQ